MRISHKVVYSVRVTTTLAQRGLEAPGRPVSGRVLAETDHLPPGFLDDILRALRTGGVLKSQRGGEGGWTLARAPETITVADVIRAVEGPLASVRGVRPHELAAAGEQEPFISLWIAVRASLRSVLEHVTLADLAAGELPAEIAALAADPDAWDERPRDARSPVTRTPDAPPALAPTRQAAPQAPPAPAARKKRAGGRTR